MAQGQFTLRVLPEFLRDAAIPTSDVLHRLLLFDFETGKTDLLPVHRTALDRYVVPYINSDSYGVQVFVGGLASRAMGRAPAENNQYLAFGRAQRVTRYLEFRSEVRRGRHALIARAYGAKRSVGGLENSEYHRAVLIVVARMPPIPRPPEARRSPGPLPLFNRFKINLTYSIEGGEAVGVGRFFFELDYDRNFPNSPEPSPTRYELRAVGGTIGAPVGSNLGGNAWNSFQSERMCTTADFEGRAGISSVGAWVGYGVGRMALHLYPARGSEILIDPFQTEYSAAIGASILWGPFQRG